MMSFASVAFGGSVSGTIQLDEQRQTQKNPLDVCEMLHVQERKFQVENSIEQLK